MLEKICPNCEYFYLHGRSEWEDHPKCEDCTRRGGVNDNFKEKSE